MRNKNILLIQSFELAKEVLQFYCNIENYAIKTTIGKQLLRSGTAIGALSREAQNAESKADFIHKLSIALKECNESLYWIELFISSGESNIAEAIKIKSDLGSLYKILSSIILSCKQQINK